MNIHPSGNTWSSALGPSPHGTLQAAKNLIDVDEGGALETFEQMLAEQVISGTTPSGESGNNLLMYAVQKAALFSFSSMVSTLGDDAPEGLNHQNWHGNTVWHLMALHLGDLEFLETGGWFNEVHDLLDALPDHPIDWSLRNLQDETALETAQRLGKGHLADWLTAHGADQVHAPMDIGGK